MLLSNAAFIFAMFLLFAACGWWAVAPFRLYIRYPIAVAIPAGMLLLACTALMIQVVTETEFTKALALAIVVLIAGSIAAVLAYGYKEIVQDALVVVSIAVVAAFGVTFLMTPAEVRTGEPALAYAIGTDHLGYAHVADWLRIWGRGTGVEAPAEPVGVVKPGIPRAGPYVSWPDLSFKIDPRFGSFSLIAMLSVFTGRSGVFTYDLACAVALAAGAIGLGGLFGRRWWAFALCTAALIVSPLLENAHLGFFGKLNGFPAALLVTGLYFNLVRADLEDGVQTLPQLCGVAAVTAASAMMFSGYVTALALAAFGSLDLVFRFVANLDKQWRETIRVYVRPAMTLLALIILAVLSYGVVTRPLYLGNPPIAIPWKELWYTAAGVAGLIKSLGELPSSVQGPLAMLLPVTVLLIGLVSFRTKQPEVAALILGSAVFIVLLFLTDDRWRFHQTTTLYITASLCAAAGFAGRLSFRDRSRAIHSLGALVLIVCCLIGAYRSEDVVSVIGGGPDTAESYIYTAAELDGLTAKVEETGAVTVDVVPLPQPNLVLMVGFGRNDVTWQFSEESWKLALGYRSLWKYPGDKGYPLRIVLRTEANTGKPNLIYRTRQFDLLLPE